MSSVVHLDAEAGPLRRRLGPVAWVVLEQVLLDADPSGPPWSAATSTRALAEVLGLDVGSVARALRRLRQAGLVEAAHERGSGGRFGLAGYLVPAPIVGLRPCAASPCTATPHTVRPVTAAECTDRGEADLARRRALRTSGMHPAGSPGELPFAGGAPGRVEAAG